MLAPIVQSHAAPALPARAATLGGVMSNILLLTILTMVIMLGMPVAIWLWIRSESKNS